MLCRRRLLLIGCIFAAGQELRGDEPRPLDRAYELGRAATTRAEFERPIEICREALASPTSAADEAYAHELLGWALARRGKLTAQEAVASDAAAHDAALADFAESIVHDGQRASTYVYRATLFERLGRWDAAADDLRRALQLAPQDAATLRAAAWLLAAAPDDQYRDAPLAIDAANQALAIDRERDYRSLDVAAAAQANAGNFDEAARLAHRAHQLAKQSASVAEQAGIARRIERYHRQQPYRLGSAPTAKPADTSANGADPAARQASQPNIRK